MEENNGESLENFSWYISQKFEINESDLISCLHNDKKNYWNTLFSLIKEKREVMNCTEAIMEDNNNKENENKDDIVKEIDNYFKENPEEAEPTWNKYKIEVLKINKVKNPIPPKEKSIAKKIIDKKINNNNNNKMNNSLKIKAPAPQKRKQSFAIQKDNIQKFNFSIGFPSTGPQNNDNILRRTMNFSNNYNSLLNKPKNKKTKFVNSKPNKNDNNNKLRNSMYLKIKQNPNFEYAPKRFFNPKNMRKSINQKENKSASFKHSFNNSTDQKDSSVIKISKKKFNELIHKNTIEEKENEFGENIYEEIEEKDEEKSTGKKEENSDYKSEYKVGIEYENEGKILSFEDSELESKVNLDDINNHNGPNTNEKNKELTGKVSEYNIDNKPDYSKDYELSKEITNHKMKINNEKEKNQDKEEINIPLYKNKNNILTLKKPKPKPKVKFSSDSKKKPKVYLNLSLSHQVNFSLNIKNNSQNLVNSVPNLLKEKQNETNKSLDLLAKKDAIKKNNSNIITARSDQKPVRKNLALKNQKLVNNRSKMMNNNNNNKNNLSYKIFKINSRSKNMNINMRNKNNYQTLNINNNSLYNMTMNKTFYKYDKIDNHKSEYLKTTKKKDSKIRPLHKSQQNLNSKEYKNNKYNNNNYGKYNKINNAIGINKLKKNISRKNRSSNKEKEGQKKRKNNRVLNENVKSNINLIEKENEINKIKNNYLKKYRETIENIMKNDETIFSENSHFVSYTDRENRKDKIDDNKNDASLSYHRTKIKIRKATNSKSKISPNKSKKFKGGSRNVIKRYIHSSMDNIY